MFVGRRRELGILRSFLDNALAGSGTLALVAGEPGIGKTSLAARVADDCRSANIAVAGGRCGKVQARRRSGCGLRCWGRSPR